MTALPLRTLHLLRAAAGLFTASIALAQPASPAMATLEALQLAPESAGTLVYRGRTFRQGAPAAAPLYLYERRVLSTPEGMIASHITRDATGRVVLVESALLSSRYETLRAELTNRQSGITASVRLSSGGRHLAYGLNDNGKLSHSSEEVSDPVVCGPSLFGFILEHWDPLIAGTRVPVRMLVLKEKTTYKFELKFESQVNGQTTFAIVASSRLVRLLVAPMRVVFDAHSRHVVRYEGRVPPMENVAGKLKDLDARVEYTGVSAAYH